MIAQLTDDQLRKMRHALGLNYNKKPSRNYFYTSSKCPDWNALVDKGFAQKNGGWDDTSCYYWLTFESAKAVYAKPMSKKYFEALP